MTLTDNQRARYARNRRHGYTATRALEIARRFDGTDYGIRPAYRSVWGGKPSDSVRWCEDVYELRVVGFCDEVTGGSHRYIRNPIDHKGWYTDPWGDGDLYRGLVLQLPGKHEARYLAAYADPNCDGAALVDLSHIWGDECDAAMSADQFAEEHAEREREYQTAWQAGAKWADLGEDVARERRDLLAALAERRKVKAEHVPTLCRLLRLKVADVLERISESRDERARLKDGDSDGLYFWTGNRDLADAFNDGAGEVVL